MSKDQKIVAEAIKAEFEAVQYTFEASDRKAERGLLKRFALALANDFKDVNPEFNRHTFLVKSGIEVDNEQA